MIRLKELRILNNLSQCDLAKIIGCTQTAVGKYERGQLEPNITILKILSNYFNVSIDYLVGNADEFGNINVQNNLTREEQRLLNAFNKLNDVTREKLIEDAEFYAGNVGAGSKNGAVRK